MSQTHIKCFAITAVVVTAFVLTRFVTAAGAEPAYRPIDPALAGKTIMLTGHDLSIDEVMEVARGGAKVRFSPEALALGQARWDLLAEGDVEGLAIYGVNRGNGAGREEKASRDERDRVVHGRDLAGARYGGLPEIDDEAVVRAFLVIQANHFPYYAAPADYMNAVIELLNHDVTPVMYGRGTLGEGDLPLTSNFHATLAGRGEAYFKGKRMKASDALAAAGLKPFTSNMAKATSEAYSTALGALLVDEGRHALEWADLTLAMDLVAMNSSITPLVPSIQAQRPFAWVNWEDNKLLAMLHGTYLLEDDPGRLLQDGEGLRAAHVRLGSAWQAWANLRDSVTMEINYGEQNPAVILDAKPEDHWVMSTPWLKKYFIKGGPVSHGRSGYILSDASWDPYPMTNDVESFNLAFANFAVTVPNRVDRYSPVADKPFFTGIKPAEVLSPTEIERSPLLYGSDYAYWDLWREYQTLTQSIPPNSAASDSGVEDIEALTRLKAWRGRQALDLFMQITGYDLLTSTYWLDVRRKQNPQRQFGPAISQVWMEFREQLPWQAEPDSRPDVPFNVIAFKFLMTNRASKFMRDMPPMPATPQLLIAR